jgi:hypothetical protein
MTYKQLADTFNMLASKRPDGFVMDFAECDEWGIDLEGFDLSPAEIRSLAEMGWALGCDHDEWDEEKMKAWIHPQNHSDEEIVEVFNRYKSIYKYA